MKRFDNKALATIIFAFVAFCLAPPLPSYGVVTLSVEQTPSAVVISYNGSWDAWGTASSNIFSSELVNGAQFLNITNGIDEYEFSESFPLTSGTWTSSGTINASSVSGDRFGFSTSLVTSTTLYAPSGYTSGLPITGSLTFAGNDLETMGFTPNSSGVFSGGGNTVNFTVGAIPEPSSYGFLLGAAGLATAIFFRRRRRPSAA